MLKTFGPQSGLVISLLGALCASSSIHAEPVNAAAREIALLENVYSQSFVTGDTSIVRRLVADDFVGVEPDGKMSDKATLLADATSVPRPTSLKIPALTIRLHGDTAIALGTEEDTMPGASKPTHGRWLDTWRRTPRGWRLVGSAEMMLPH